MNMGTHRLIPVGMVMRKHFCRKCGARLGREPITRTVTPQDPDWDRYDRMGRTRRLPIGEIKVTEYRFKCPECEDAIEYDAQSEIRLVQKKLGKTLLSDAEVGNEREWARGKLRRRGKITYALALLGMIAVVVLYMLLSGRLGITLRF